MLAGRHIVLRAWQESDVEFFHALRNDVATQLSLMGEPRPHTTSQARDWLAARTDCHDGVFLVIATSPEGEAVGFIELRSIRPVHGHATLGICLARDARGRGWASEAITLVEQYSRDVLGLRKLILQVLVSHERAVGLYHRTGYQRVGVYQRHFYCAGTYHDVLLMEKTLPNPSSNGVMPWTQ